MTISLVRTAAYLIINRTHRFVSCAIGWIALLLYLSQALYQVIVGTVVFLEVADKVVKHFVRLMHSWLPPNFFVHLS